MFNNIAGIKLVHIPYRGDAQMITALISGDIQLGFPAAGQRHRQCPGQADPRPRRHRHQANDGAARRPDRCRNRGSRDLEVGSWIGLFAPAGTPPDIVRTVQQNVAKALADPKVRECLV